MGEDVRDDGCAVLGETVGEGDGECVSDSASPSGGDGERVGMRVGEAVGSPVGDAVGRLLRVDVGIGVHLSVGAGVSRIVCAVGFGNCVAWYRRDVRTKASVQPVSLSPSQHGATVGVADTVKTTKSMRLPTI